MRILAAVLVILLFVVPVFALCEGDAPAGAASTVDLTGVLVAVVLVAFDFLLAWIARVVVPPAKAFLEQRTTGEQRALIWDAVLKAVDAAEQTIRGPGRGEQKLAYVQQRLYKKGYSVDLDTIEAAVKRMNERAAAAIAPAFLPDAPAEPAETEAP